MTRMIARILIGLSLAFSACAGASSREVHTPSGGHGYLIECRKPSDCVEEAGRLCTTWGYTVIDAGQHTEDNALANGFAAYSAAMSKSNENCTHDCTTQQQPAPRYTTTTREMLIECGGRDDVNQ